MVRETTSLKASVEPKAIMLSMKEKIMVRKMDQSGRLVRGSTYRC